MNKDQTKKLVLGSFGLVGLLYVYFTFFLGPLNKSRNALQVKIKDLQTKTATSKAEISKATKLEETAHAATDDPEVQHVVFTAATIIEKK